MSSGRRTVSVLRVGFGLLGISAVAGGILALARALPPTGWGVAFGIVAGLVLMPLLASPLEWLVHRYVYHRALLPGLRPIYEIHHRVHHHVFFPTWRYVTSGPPRRIPVFAKNHDRAEATGTGNAAIHLAHWTFYMLIAAGLIWVPCALLGSGLPLLAGLVLASVVVCELMISVHDTIHRPGTYPLVEQRSWFRFLDEHHYIHHVDTEANVNFLLPLSDWLFGTLRRTLTEPELRKHGTWQNAKSRLVGAGEPAHEAVAAAPPAVTTEAEPARARA
jgi:hypothetical protein